MSKLAFQIFFGDFDFLSPLLCYVTEMEHRSVKKAGIEVQEVKGWSDSSYVKLKTICAKFFCGSGLYFKNYQTKNIL